MGILRHVQGNLLRLAVPLTLRTVTMEGGEAVAEDSDFTPKGGKVTVRLTNVTRRFELAAVTRDGNVAVAEDRGTLPTGRYHIEIVCAADDGRPLRFKQRDVLEVVDATADAGIEAGVEFEAETHRLDGAVFLAVGTGGSLEVESDPVFTASPAAGITDEDIKKWNKGGNGKGVDPRPVVHRCIPFRPLVGTRYYFETEVLVKLPPTAVDTDGNVPVLDELDDPDARVNNYYYINNDIFKTWKGKPMYVLARLNYRHRMVTITEDILQEDGTVDLVKLVARLEEKKSVYGHGELFKTECLPTMETRSPNFRIEHGRVLCVARCDKEWAQETLRLLAKRSAMVEMGDYDPVAGLKTGVFTLDNRQFDEDGLRDILVPGAVLSLVGMGRVEDNGTSSPHYHKMVVTGMALYDGGERVRLTCRTVTHYPPYVGRVPLKIQDLRVYAVNPRPVDRKVQVRYKRRDEGHGHPCRLRLERGALLRRNVELRRKARGKASSIAFKCNVKLRRGKRYSDVERTGAGYESLPVMRVSEKA